MVSDAELEQLGLFARDDPFPEERLALLRYLLERGATTDELLAYRDRLPALVTVLALRGGEALTAGQVAARTGLSDAQVRQIIRAAGFPEAGDEGRPFNDGFADLCLLVSAASELFGENAVLQLVRVMGSAMARVADALVSSFLANIEPAARHEDPVGLRVAQANAEAMALFPQIAPTLGVLLRQHMAVAQRAADPEREGTFETRHLCVGFVDLVDSTGLAERLSMGELGGVLTLFENLTTDTVTETGGRVVKLIGDEVLFVAADESTGCAIALDLAELLGGHATVPAVHIGVASGEVMLRDGDVFGPVVNLAARAAKVGGPGQVVAPVATAQAAGRPMDRIGRVELPGFGAVELARLCPLTDRGA